MPALVSMRQLLEAGVHVGHEVSKSNQHMRRFIFTERNGIQIINLQQTVACLGVAYDYVRDLVASDGLILFVGTKEQAQEAIETEAQRAGMPYVNHRWLGGTLTLGGIKEITRPPDTLFIVDPPTERDAMLEALCMGIPIVAMCDTDADPDEVDHPIPSNTDAIGAVKLITAEIADACIEGQTLRRAGSSPD